MAIHNDLRHESERYHEGVKIENSNKNHTSYIHYIKYKYKKYNCKKRINLSNKNRSRLVLKGMIFILQSGGGNVLGARTVLTVF
jgi:hypothetical protein